MSKRETISDYDEEADVMYINFWNPPEEADDTIRLSNVLYRYKKHVLIGITIIDWKRTVRK